MKEFEELEKNLKDACEQLTKKWNEFDYDEQLEYYYVFTTRNSIEIAINAINDYKKKAK